MSVRNMPPIVREEQHTAATAWMTATERLTRSRDKDLFVRLAKSLLATCLFFCSANFASSASFDCRKAHTQMEVLVCGSPTLDHADMELAKLYGDAKTAALAMTVVDMKALRENQRSWVKYSASNCTERKCLADAYRDQISLLKQFVNHPSHGFSLTGEFHGLPGRVKLLEMPNGLIRFGIDAEYKDHVGSITGVVSRVADKGTFTDPDDDCSFKFNSGRAVVTVDQQGTCGFGLNVDATGAYLNSSSSSPHIQD
jgi:uncharacterized protein YecT (DUF1311 family)